MLPPFPVTRPLKDYTKDGPYVRASMSREESVGRAMSSGALGDLTIMVTTDGRQTPLGFTPAPTSTLTFTISENGAKGEAASTDLESQILIEDIEPNSNKPPRGKRVSGSLTWTCGTVGRIDAKMNDAVNGSFKKPIPAR